MKKYALLLFLIVIVSTSAFAKHPSGWGIGIVGQYGFTWDGIEGSPGFALSLKAPKSSTYWGINLNINDGAFGLGITGDKYVIDRTFIPGINFGFFMGPGGYAGIHYNGEQWNSVRGGLRVPIGFCIIPFRFIEVFANIAPSFGLEYDFREKALHFPEAGVGFDLGLRIWF